MKKLNGFWTAILILLSSVAYSQGSPQTQSIVKLVDVTGVVILPDSIAAKVIDELLVKDHLVFELNKKDSIITSYQQDIEGLKSEVGQYKLNEADYETVIGLEREKTAFMNDLVKEKNKKIFWHKVKEGALITLAALELVIIAMLTTK